MFLISNRAATVGVTIAACALLLNTSCSQSRHAPDEKYVLVATNTKLAYWQAAAKGLADSAARLGAKADMVGPETYSPSEQRDAFRKAVAGKPSGIMISAADPQLLNEDINSAIASGIPVITMDSDAPASKRLLFVGTDNYQAGVMGGRTLVHKLGRKGNVVVFTIPAQTNLIERIRGYHDAIANTEIKVIQTVDIQGNAALAFDKMTELMEKSKQQIDAFVCTEATAGAQVAEVLDRKKQTGKTIIAMDTDDETLKWIEKGAIAATIGQKPYTMAFYGLHVLDDLHHNGPKALDGDFTKLLESPIPAGVDTGSSLIDQSNVSLLRKPGK